MKRIPGITRRGFIHRSAGLALAAGGAGWASASLAAAPKARWPIACRDGHLKVTGQEDCWAALKALGADGVEASVTTELACPGLFHPAKKYAVDTPENLRVLKADLKANGLKITAFMMANRFDERLEQEIEWTRKLVSAAKELDIRAVRIDLIPHKVPREQFLPFALEACKQLCRLVEGTNIRYGIENHGNTTNDPEFLGKLFEGVGSKHLGLTLDTGNFYWYGHPLGEVYKAFAQFAARVVHTHCKSISYPQDRKNTKRPMGWEYAKFNCPIYEGDIDFKRVIQILQQAGYQGDLCVENESLDKFPANQRAEVLRHEIAWLKGMA